MTENECKDEVALLPCPDPWCDAGEREGDFSPVAVQRYFGNWQVQCTCCCMDGPLRATEAEAIAAWNTRPNGWREIESAPIHLRQYHGSTEQPHVIACENGEVFEARNYDGAWYRDGENCNPTHWQSLPTPPHA